MVPVRRYDVTPLLHSLGITDPAIAEEINYTLNTPMGDQMDPWQIEHMVINIVSPRINHCTVRRAKRPQARH